MTCLHSLWGITFYFFHDFVCFRSCIVGTQGERWMPRFSWLLHITSAWSTWWMIRFILELEGQCRSLWGNPWKVVQGVLKISIKVESPFINTYQLATISMRTYRKGRYDWKWLLLGWKITCLCCNIVVHQDEESQMNTWKNIGKWRYASLPRNILVKYFYPFQGGWSSVWRDGTRLSDSSWCCPVPARASIWSQWSILSACLQFVWVDVYCKPEKQHFWMQRLSKQDPSKLKS